MIQYPGYEAIDSLESILVNFLGSPIGDDQVSWRPLYGDQMDWGLFYSFYRVDRSIPRK